MHISGPRLRGRPLLDRIDIHMEVPRVAYDKLANATRGEPSEAIRARIGATRERQQQRFAGVTGLVCNTDMGPAQIRESASRFLWPARGCPGPDARRE